MLYDSEKRDISIALTGDLMLTQRLSVFKEERFLLLREVLRGSDVAFANLEGSVHEYDEGTPNLIRGTFMTTEPKFLDDIKWFGFNIVSCANNHAFDYGEGGILANNRHLDAHSIPHTGTGRNLGEARSPAYLETPAGRVALVAASAIFNEWAQAGDQRTDSHGRPGVNPLAFQTSYVVDRKAVNELRRISTSLGLEAEKERQMRFGFLSPSEIGIGNDKEFIFMGKKFLVGDKFAIQTKANEKDVADNLRQVREARRQADWVMVSLHYHEMGGPSFLTARTKTEQDHCAAFVEDVARRCIDEGADVIVGHGPHYALGVELYKGKPIFHSLGNIILQNDTVRFLPAHAYSRLGLDNNATPADFLDARSKGDTRSMPAEPLYWQTICPVCKFSSGKLKEIILYPVDLGYGRSRSQRGRPLIADAKTGREIISRLTRISKPLGTKITYRNGCGVITVA